MPPTVSVGHVLLKTKRDCLSLPGAPLIPGIDPQNSTVAPLRFGNGYEISSHSLQCHLYNRHDDLLNWNAAKLLHGRKIIFVETDHQALWNYCVFRPTHFYNRYPIRIHMIGVYDILQASFMARESQAIANEIKMTRI